jgi:hypothetical protein
MAATSRSGLVFALIGVGFSSALSLGACSGGEFSEAGAGNGSGGSAGSTGSGASSSGGKSSMGGGGAVPGRTCTGPEQCDDADPCTIDECGVQSVCVYTPKCGATELCCDGTCSQCCVQADCTDEVGCTTDTCFAGFCAYVPDDDACGSAQYCHSLEDCKDREVCPGGTPEECDDEDPCTDDTCTSSLCYHAYCGSGEQCCPGVGCASCCSDSQCENDDDLCTKEVCTAEGRCQSGPLCSDGQQCCEGADNATCGACCVPDDCDDGIPCTVENCLDGQCSHTANNELCDDGEICDPLQDGCVPVAMCDGPEDCVSADKCQTGSCVMGQCMYIGCDPLKVCCPATGCQECCSDYNCGEIQISPDGDCQHNHCMNGKCSVGWDPCGGINDYCCAPYGCYTGGCPI